MTLLRPLVLAPALLLATTGCLEDFFNVDEACHPEGRIPGVRWIEGDNPTVEGMNRINCHRRLSGLGLASINRQVQEVVDQQVNFVTGTPDVELLFGDRREIDWFNQTGRILSRLDNAGYVFFDASAVQVWESLYWQYVRTDNPGHTGADAVDELVRDFEIRENILRRSWLDGGYREITLGADWLNNGGACEAAFAGQFQCVNGSVPDDAQIRLHYLVAIARAPGLERTTRPFTYPRNEMLNVPLFSLSRNIDELAIANSPLGVPPPVRLGFPITIYGNTQSSDTIRINDQNWYGLRVDARLDRVDGAGLTEIPTETVFPGDSANDQLPSAFFIRESVALFPLEPLEPNTTYQFRSDVDTYSGFYNVDITFTTALEDPGVEGEVLVGAATSRLGPQDILRFRDANPHAQLTSQVRP